MNPLTCDYMLSDRGWARCGLPAVWRHDESAATYCGDHGPFLPEISTAGFSRIPAPTVKPKTMKTKTCMTCKHLLVLRSALPCRACGYINPTSAPPTSSKWEPAPKPKRVGKRRGR
jgi:hypothetical protein